MYYFCRCDSKVYFPVPYTWDNSICFLCTVSEYWISEIFHFRFCPFLLRWLYNPAKQGGFEDKKTVVEVILFKFSNSIFFWCSVKVVGRIQLGALTGFSLLKINENKKRLKKVYSNQVLSSSTAPILLKLKWRKCWL